MATALKGDDGAWSARCARQGPLGRRGGTHTPMVMLLDGRCRATVQAEHLAPDNTIAEAQRNGGRLGASSCGGARAPPSSGTGARKKRRSPAQARPPAERAPWTPLQAHGPTRFIGIRFDGMRHGQSRWIRGTRDNELRSPPLDVLPCVPFAHSVLEARCDAMRGRIAKGAPLGAARPSRRRNVCFPTEPKHTDDRRSGLCQQGYASMAPLRSGPLSCASGSVEGRRGARAAQIFDAAPSDDAYATKRHFGQVPSHVMVVGLASHPCGPCEGQAHNRAHVDGT